MGYLPSFVGEGAIYGRYVVASMPQARIAVLYENTDYGRDLTKGLRRGLGRRAGGSSRFAATRPRTRTSRRQVSQLKRSGANTFMLFATPGFAIQAFLSAHRQAWRPAPSSARSRSSRRSCR